MRNNFLLDADETVLDFIRSSKESLAYAMDVFGLPYEKKDYDVYKRINDGLWKEYEQGKFDKKYLMSARFTRFFDFLKVKADAAAVNNVYFEKLSSTGYLLDGAEQFLKKLRELGSVYLITNGTAAAQYGRLRSLGLENFFDGVFVSDEIGYAKPDKRFFEYVLAKIGKSADECIVIGDSLSSDIAGARNAGIASVWYDPACMPTGNIKPDYIARSYAEILETVKKSRV